MAGKFITFEGGEGAGKSTQIARLTERLEGEGIATVVTREPGGTPAAEAIRDLILSGLAEELGAEGEAALFAAARVDHVERVIRPALASGAWVLCDRFFDSTRVYQGATGGADPGLLDALDRVAVGSTRPDLTIILDVPAKVGLARAAKRQQQAGGRADRFERETLRIHEVRRRAYLAIARNDPDRCAVVDADRAPEATAHAVWRLVTGRLLEHAA